MSKLLDFSPKGRTQLRDILAEYSIEMHGEGALNYAECIQLLDVLDTTEARLSRYEMAMREALNANGAPLGAWQDPRMVLLAAGNRTDRVHEILRAALSDQPAEKPAESKLEAVFQKHIRQCQSMVETFDRVGPEHMKTFHQGMVAGLERAIEIINYRDARPSTPEEGAKETKR